MVKVSFCQRSRKGIVMAAFYPKWWTDRHASVRHEITQPPTDPPLAQWLHGTRQEHYYTGATPPPTLSREYQGVHCTRNGWVAKVSNGGLTLPPPCATPLSLGMHRAFCPLSSRCAALRKVPSDDALREGTQRGVPRDHLRQV